MVHSRHDVGKGRTVSWRESLWWIPARDQHLRAAAGDLGGVRARRCLAAAAARAGDDRGRRGLQHPDRGRREAAGRARPRGRAARLGGGGAGLLCHRGCLREDVGAVRRGHQEARAVRRDLSRPARRHGGGEHRGRRRRAAAPHPHDRRRRHADRGEPRLSRQPHARHGEPCHRAGRLSHLSAHRHGRDRQARRRASGPPAQGEAAGLSRLPPARFPDPAGLAVHLHRAGQEHLRSRRRARGRREEPQPGHRQRHPHAGLSAGRHRPMRTGAGGLRPRQGSGRSRSRQACPDREGAGEGLRRRAARSRRRGAARHRAFEERQEADRARRRAGQPRRRRHLRHGRAAGAP